MDAQENNEQDNVVQENNEQDNTEVAFGLMGLLIALRAARVLLEVDAVGLRVEAPPGVLTPSIRKAIRQHKDALEVLPRPYLNIKHELIMPSFAPPQYHWQPVAATLRELDAPAETWRLRLCENLQK